ncbi:MULTISPECIES: hypothetical protein [Mesorhizobium]|uniref:hypothetical protein n=1 Tax=Mesorhizobium TaxID=68287 RepID=UPI0003CF2CFB|nr:MULTISPECIES: hypothetical protein [Mesorhizobium]ESY65256.1 hypothetical protein X742_23260 [Mesorhizobium sp. LNHC232B00]WJI38755.1 hypothetical protein NL534_00305 [Mesorhizobium opportunistum]
MLIGAGYQFTDSFSGVLGYRASGVDYSNGGFTYDVVQQGPIIGAVFRFRNSNSAKTTPLHEAYWHRREDEPRDNQETADDDQPWCCQRHERPMQVMIK